MLTPQEFFKHVSTFFNSMQERVNEKRQLLDISPSSIFLKRSMFLKTSLHKRSCFKKAVDISSYPKPFPSQIERLSQ